MGVNVAPLLLKQSSRKLNPCLKKSRRLRGAPQPSAHPSRMLKKRALAPRAPDPSAVNAPFPLSVQRVTSVLRVPHPADVRLKVSVPGAQHAPTRIAPPPASGQRVPSMTVPPRGNDPLMVTARLAASAETVNAPPMATAPHAPPVPIQTVLGLIVLGQTGPTVTGPTVIGPKLTARASSVQPLTVQGAMSVPLASDPGVRLDPLMTAPASRSVLRAP